VSDATSFDVLIIGGGMAGLSCALFAARANLAVAVFDQGRSSLRRVERVYNYLGFPEGVGGSELIELGRRQAERFGAVFFDLDVARVERRADGFLITAGDRDFGSRFVVLAANKRTDLATQLGLPLGGFGNRFVSVDGDGQTAIPGIYAIGRITGLPSQAVISAGEGARTAIAIVQKIRGEYYVDHDT
jgi:thioredoxin reductase (NADPH)